MLEMRPDCERCGMDLPADAPGAFICSMECTFCTECADAMDERCPIAAANSSTAHAVGEDAKGEPASTERRFQA